MWDEAPMLKNV